MILILSRFIEDFLLIKKGEERKLLFFLLFYSILMMAQELGAGVSLSLFLTRAGISRLPMMLLMAAVINFSAVITYMHFSARKDNRSLFSLIIWTAVAVIVPARLLSNFLPQGVSYLVYAASEFMTGIVGLHFSVYIADYFDTLQSKRLFPLIFAGSRIGGVMGGLILSFASKSLGTINLLWLWGAFLIGAYFLLIRIDSTFPPQVFDYEKQSRETSQFFKYMRSGFDFLKRSLLLKSLAAGLFLLGMLSLIIKFLYSEVFVSTFPDADRLTAFFGYYTIAANLLGFIIQVALANRIIDSLGLGAANNLYACSFTSGFLGLVLHYGFPAALWARFTDEQLESAIQDPVESLLYNGVPDHERARARALSSGLIKPVSEITGSLILQFMKGFFVPSQIAIFGFFASLAYVTVAMMQNKGYVEGLMHMVKERTLSLEDLTNLRWEKASKKDLDALYGLAMGKEAAVRDSSITLLLHLDEDLDFPRLAKGFMGWSPGVQEEFLKNYFLRCNPVDEDFLLFVLPDVPVNVKVIIIEYFIETASERASEKLQAFLEPDADIHVQNSAIRYFIITDHNGGKKAQKLLEERLKSGEDRIVHGNLAIIRDLYDESYLNYVRNLTESENRSIAVDAVKTLGQIYRPIGRDEKEVFEITNRLMEKKGYQEIRAAATIMGKRIGQREQEFLLSLLDTTSAPLREFVTDLLIKNYSSQVELFLQKLESQDTPMIVKENLVLVLQKINRITDQERLKGILKQLIADYFHLILEQEWLRNNSHEHSLMLELNERKKNQIRITILELLEVFLHQKVVVSIEKALLTKNPRLISNAMELFENLWDKKQAKSLITLLYPGDFDEELKIAGKFFDNGDNRVTGEKILARYLKPNMNRWDICASLLLLKGEPIVNFSADREVFINHKDPLVAEMARSVFNDKTADEGGKMLTNIEKIICLKNAPIFKSLKMDELNMVAEIARERNCSEGEVIIEKGEVGSAMFIIASGEVEVYLPGNPRKTLVNLAEPEFFGEMAIFGDDVRSASIMALKPTLLLCLERDHFFNLIYEKPEISIEIIKVLSDRLRWMDHIARTSSGK